MGEFWPRSRALGLAIAVHLLMAAVVVLGTMDWKPFRPPTLAGLTIEAVMVDTDALKKRRAQARQEAEQAVRRQAEKDRRIKELEERKAREAREKLAAEAAEKQRIKQQAAKKREEDLRLQNLRKKQAQDRKDRMEKQRRELEDLRKRREQATRQRKIEEQRLKQIDARRKADADKQRQARAEAEMQKQMANEQAAVRAGRLATLKEKYALAIQAQVTNNWLRPPTARPGLRCTLKIVQIPGGEVISAAIAGSCNGDEATRRSLVAAVERAGTLPYRGFEGVFEREIDFNFKFDGN